MQRNLLLCVLWISMDSISACNICSCSSMGNSLGIMPRFRSHFVGLRETYRSYQTEHPASILYPEGKQSTEVYRHSELWGRWYPHQRVQVFAFLPYNRLKRSEADAEKSIQGLGDLSLLVNYLLLQTSDSSRSNYQQVLMLGGGMKLNTGKYQSELEPNFQLGSGARDYLFNMSYTGRFKQWGFMGEGNTRYNGTNASGYQLGSKWSASTRLFTLIGQDQRILMPYFYLNYEQTEADRLKGKVQDYTGGRTSYAGLGADFYIQNIQVGADLQLPLKQNMGEGYVQEFPRIRVNIVYHFRNSFQCQ